MVSDETDLMSKSSPQPAAERVANELRHTIFGPISWVAETESTNADLLAAARRNAAHGMVVVTDHQTGGRGRRGRTWTDRTGAALLVSVLLRTESAIEPNWIVSASSIALVEAVRALGVDAWIKWPNDVVVPQTDGDAKLAGVLAESIVTSGRVEAVVVGIGCNVTAEAVDGIDNATAVEVEAPRAVPVDRAQLLIDLLGNLDVLLRDLGSGVGDVPATYRRLSATIGSLVRVDLHDRSIVGLAVDIDDGGRLVLRNDAGQEAVTAGDVVHLRPVSRRLLE
jgi:BirA family transcriptional regulator, biotin operon repressor / biotin---[acetyl-CoA-carboxylase] ligase